MRFANLHLLKYGNFDGCELTFSVREQDFQLIEGPNEVGKSTTLDAVSDVLFGFPHAKTQDYRFDAALLRVAATLEDGAESLVCQRKRGRTGSLMDLAGQMIQESRLIAMLHGQTRETFRLAWSLNHKQLREGGQSIAEAKDDVGQAIFAAGSGLTGVTGVLRTLETESEAIWKKRANTSSTWHIANRDLQAALQSVKTNGLRPKDWLEARERLSNVQKRKDELQQQRSDLQAEDRSIQRIRRLAIPFRRWRELQDLLDGRSLPLLSEAEELAFDPAMEALTAARRTCDTSEELRAGYRSQLEGLERDPEILKIADELEELLEQRGAVRGGLNDLPKREAELALERAGVTALLRDLRMVELPIQELVASLPSRARILHLRGLARERERLSIALQKSQEYLAQLEARKNNLAEQHLLSQPAEGIARLQTAVLAARRIGLLDEGFKEAAKRQLSKERTAAELLLKLKPWTGEANVLVALSVPPEEVLGEHRKCMDSCSAAIEEAGLTIIGLKETVAQNRLNREQLMRSGRVVSVSELKLARDKRDGAWTDLRAHLFGNQQLTAIDAAADDFESHVMKADVLADDRYVSAEESARLTVLDDTFASLELRIEQAEARLAVATSEQEDATISWKTDLRTRGLPVLSPPRLREWIADRTAALIADTELSEAREQTQDIATRRSEAISQLHSSLPGDRELIPPPPLFAPLLDHAETVLAELRDRQSAHDQQFLNLQSLESDVAAVAAKLVLEQAADNTNLLNYEAAVKEAGLSGRVESSVLDLHEDLRNKAEAAAILDHRVSAIRADSLELDQRITELAQPLGLAGGDSSALLDVLKRRLAEANAQEHRAGQIIHSIESAEKELRHGLARRLAAETSLAPIAAACEQTDLKFMEAFVRRSRDLRKWILEASDLHKEMLRDGDGRSFESLVQEAQGGDLDVLEQRAGEISSALAELETDLSIVGTQVGVAQEAFRTVDKGPIAVSAAADAEMARAEMNSEAEAYVLKRAQTILLRWLIERQRQSSESPLLQRAGVLFKKLTLGRYAGLTTETENGTQRLLGVSKDGATTVPLDPMSDGTKDQLYLALRVAAVEQSLANGVVLPFLADDLFINYDDDRAKAGFEVLAELSSSTQVLFFTHHNHLVDIARDVFGPPVLHPCSLR